jgi:hemerythrin-like domain-containing protein
MNTTSKHGRTSHDQNAPAKKKRKADSAASKTATDTNHKQIDSSMLSSQLLNAIYQEHRYLSVLLNVLSEQQQNMKQGKTADYPIMHEVMHYMNRFSDQFHRSKENIILKRIGKKHKQLEIIVAQIIEEHQQISALGDNIMEQLKCLLEEDSDIKKIKLQILCGDYIELLRHHLKLEEQKIFSKAEELLDEKDWLFINKQSPAADDPIFGIHVDESYQRIYQHLNDKLEKTADEVTLFEFIGFAALFESIAPLASGYEKISSIIQLRSKQAYTNNISCFKMLFLPGKAKPTARQYFSAPFNCMLNTYDCCTSALFDIAKVLKETREDMAEPYSSRMHLLDKLERIE